MLTNSYSEGNATTSVTYRFSFTASQHQLSYTPDVRLADNSNYFNFNYNVSQIHYGSTSASLTLNWTGDLRSNGDVSISGYVYLHPASKFYSNQRSDESILFTIREDDRQNSTPTGSISIQGSAIEGQTLSAYHNIEDRDGVGTVSYQWMRNGTAIYGATNTKYTLTSSDVGHKISVIGKYIDGLGKLESNGSIWSPPIEAANRLPTGTVTISGEFTRGETLVASNNIADSDGVVSISYVWLRDGIELTNVIGNLYLLTEEDIDHSISVSVRYLDGNGTSETVSSQGAQLVRDKVAKLPEGSVLISGQLKAGYALTAINTLSDTDGIGIISYQWLRNGVEIDGAVGTQYQLTVDDMGVVVSVTASYIDNQGVHESVTSAGSQVEGGEASIIVSRSSYVLALGQEIKTLALALSTGSTALNLTGNEFANTLIGNAGANQLNGGRGVDRLEGLGGNDTYIVDTAGDRVFEAAGGGT